MKYRAWVEISTVESVVETVMEIDDAAWAAMTAQEQEVMMRGTYDAIVADVANGGWEVVEE